jgi:UDP-GlcNAc:undecaprenyl-phosphate GlcNAc-1-phosphate transferase
MSAWQTNRRMSLSGWDALFACVVAAFVTAAVTPFTSMLARRVGAIDAPSERGLSDRPTPRLGGLAIFAGIVVATLIWLPFEEPWTGVLAGAALITLVGAVDDIFDLPAAVKLGGQVAAALLVVELAPAVRVESFTLPLIHHVDTSELAVPLTVLGLVAIMNAVNFSDGIDGLASGVCAIAGASFAVIAFDAGYTNPGVLAAIVAGGALGFLVHNFYPASVFMGDAGSNLLGLLLGSVAALGTVKTGALIALFLPLLVLAVPFLDTTFVVLKRMKYRRPVYQADDNHFHHRFSRIGFSQRRTVLYLYAWTLMLGGVAVATRFVPYSDHGDLRAGWATLMGALLVLALLASVYLVYVLEILKFRRLLRRRQPDRPLDEIDADVEARLETGEWEALER